MNKIDFPILSGYTILVVDDEYNNYELMKTIINKTLATVLWAENGKKAVEICNNTNIDLIFMDIKMPIMNGYDAIDIIKKIIPNTKIIICTAFTNFTNFTNILKDEYTYLYKPIDIRRMLKLMIEYL